MIRSPRRAVLALAVGALCAVALGACGDDGEKKASAARQLLEQTSEATSKSLENGRVDARLKLEPEGLLALGGPILLDVKGPIVRPAEGDRLPRADLDAVVTVGGRRFDGGLLSDGRRAFLELDGEAYRLDDRRSRRGLQSLRGDLAGLDPLSWVKGEETKGNEPIGATDTIRLTGKVDAARLLADLDGIVPARMGKQIATAVKSADFELWTGAEDKILRQLVLRVVFAFKPGSKPPIAGLEAGKLELRIRLDDVNSGPARIEAPTRSRPLSKAPKDNGLGGLLECLNENADSGGELAACVSSLGP